MESTIVSGINQFSRGRIMIKRLFASISIIFLLFYTCSCEKNKEKTSISDQNTETQDKTGQGNDFKKLYQEALLKIDDLNKKIGLLESQNAENENTVVLSQINLIDTAEFEWLNIEVWNEIRIIQYYPDYDAENTEITEF